MKAVVYHAADRVQVDEVERPHPGPGEVVVQMCACGICGSDLMDWYMSPRAPVVLGHEPSGVVVEIGPPTHHELPSLGTRVFVHHHVPCLRCDACLRGRETLCATFKNTRISPGGLAEFFLAPAENVRTDLLALPDHVSDEVATLIEPLACCVRAQRAARVGAATRLLVIGIGPMGALQLQLARARGVNNVVAAEPREERRGLAARWSARGVEPTAEAIQDAFDGLRPDVVMVCAGSLPALETALEVADLGATVSLFAPLHPGQGAMLNLTDLFFREIMLTSSYSAGPADTREALRLLSQGRLRPDELITHRFPLAEGAAALEAAREAVGLKVVVTADNSR